ncbi:hypothetical protein [Streptomyces sp. NPDC101115]|uniref:hypothetical protein n=1 Tax=Streptomyces sp. NPDC101115 TaxID=3366106 RepID=UPI00380A3957
MSPRRPAPARRAVINVREPARPLSELAWRARAVVATHPPGTPERQGARAVELALTVSRTLPEARQAIRDRRLSPQADAAAEQALTLVLHEPDA